MCLPSFWQNAFIMKSLWILTFTVAITHAQQMDCKATVLADFDSVHYTTKRIETHLTSTDATLSPLDSTTTVAPIDSCTVPMTVFTSIRQVLDLKINTTTPLPDREPICTSTNSSTAFNRTGGSCRRAFRLIQCGVEHVKAAYANDDVILTFEDNNQWENATNVLAETTSIVTTALKESMDAQRHSDLDLLLVEFGRLRSTTPCFEDVVRGKMQKAVVEDIQRNRPGNAFSWFQQLGVGAEKLNQFITQAYHQIARSPTTAVINFLREFIQVPEYGAQGMLHLMNEIKGKRKWPEEYLKFRELQLQLVRANTCLSTGMRLTLYSTNHLLEEALQTFIEDAARYINDGKPKSAKDLYVNKIGSDKFAFRRIVHRSFETNNNGENKEESFKKAINFLDQFNSIDYSTVGLNALFNALRFSNGTAGLEIFKLKEHYEKMKLADGPLWQNLEEGVNVLLDDWGSNILTDCDKLIKVAVQHPALLEEYAYSIGYRTFACGFEPYPQARKFADCFQKMPEYLQTVQGYGGFLKKMDDMNLLDDTEYVALVQRFKNFVYKLNTTTASKKEKDYKDKILESKIVKELSLGIRNLLFGVNCSLVSFSKHGCLAAPANSTSTNYYIPYLSDNSRGSAKECELKFDPMNINNNGIYRIESVRHPGFAMYAYDRTPYSDGTFRSYFWKSAYESAYWFEVTPHNRASKFTFHSVYNNGFLEDRSSKSNTGTCPSGDRCIMTKQEKFNAQKEDDYDNRFWWVECPNT